MPTKIRPVGVAWRYVVFNGMGVLMTQTAPLAISAMTWRYFIIWLVFDCLYVVTVYYWYPEMKNTSLEDLAGVFGDKVAESWEETKQYVDHVGGVDALISGEKNITSDIEAAVKSPQHIERLTSIER